MLKDVFCQDISINSPTLNVSAWAVCTDLNNYRTIVFGNDCAMCAELKTNSPLENALDKESIDFICMKCQNLETHKIIRGSTCITQLLRSLKMEIGDRRLVLVDGAYTLSLPVLLDNSIVVDISSVPFSKGLIGEMMKTEFFLSFLRWKKIQRALCGREMRENETQMEEKSAKNIFYLRIEHAHGCLNFTEGFDEMVNCGFLAARENLRNFGGRPRRFSF